VVEVCGIKDRQLRRTTRGATGEDDVVDTQGGEPAPQLASTHDERGPSWVTTRSMMLLEHAQDAVSVIVGVVLVALAGVLLVSGLVNFARDLSHSDVLDAANNLLDRVLLVLILVEIVHTVVLSLRAHTLVPQPFIVVGLVAVIRKILFILGSSQRISTAELALLIAMVGVFVAGLIAVNLFGGSRTSTALTRPSAARRGTGSDSPSSSGAA